MRKIGSTSNRIERFEYFDSHATIHRNAAGPWCHDRWSFCFKFHDCRSQFDWFKPPSGSQLKLLESLPGEPIVKQVIRYNLCINKSNKFFTHAANQFHKSIDKRRARGRALPLNHKSEEKIVRSGNACKQIEMIYSQLCTFVQRQYKSFHSERLPFDSLIISLASAGANRNVENEIVIWSLERRKIACHKLCIGKKKKKLNKTYRCYSWHISSADRKLMSTCRVRELRLMCCAVCWKDHSGAHALDAMLCVNCVI